MPPTRAAAMKTACGRFSVIQALTWSGDRRSTLSRGAVSTVHSSDYSRLTRAEPTSPRWPATQTRLPESEYSIRLSICVFALLQTDAVGLDHLRNQLLESGLVLPADLLLGLFRAAEQEIHLGRPVIDWIDGDQNVAGLVAMAFFVGALAFPHDLAVDMTEGELDEFAHRMHLAGGEHVVVRLVLLQDAPHAFDIVAGMEDRKGTRLNSRH